MQQLTIAQIEARRAREAAIVAWTESAGIYDIWADRFVGRTR